MPTLYGVLDVEPGADEQRIVRAYREQVKTHHPDVTDDPEARTRFMRLKTAKEVLTDETERARYDKLDHETYVSRHLDGWDDSEQTASAGGTVDGKTISEAAARMAERTPSATAEARSSPQVSASDGYATASEYYQPGQRVGVESPSRFGRTLGELRDVLPWLLAHLALLGGAIAVAVMLLSGTSNGGLPPVTSIAVAAAMVGVTAAVSILHITSTVYR